MKEAKRRNLGVALAVLGLGAAGCYGNPRDFHPGWNQGQSGGSTGQAGYSGGGQGGSGAGSGAGTGGDSGVVTTCSTTAPTAFAVEWAVEDTAHHPTTCTAVGGATVDLDVLNLATSIASHDTFPCDAMAGTSSTLDPGNYTVALRLYDANGVNLYEQIGEGMFAITAGCTTDLGLAPFFSPVITPDQYISLSWSIDRPSNGAYLSCADAHASTVELDANDQTFQWPCTDGKGATKSLPPATYSVKIKLLDATGTVLSITPTMPVAVVAGKPNTLGNVLFDVN
jgi:hypothetical protein